MGSNVAEMEASSKNARTPFGSRYGLPSHSLAVLCGLYLAALSWPVQAGIYKWTDDQGRVHYTQTPPPAGTTRASIDTDTFSTIHMHKAQPVSTSTKRAKASTKKRHTTVRRKCRRR